MENDQTVYKIILEPGNASNKMNVEILAYITGANYADIKKYIDAAPVILVKDYAPKVKRIRDYLLENHILFTIEPDFRY